MPFNDANAPSPLGLTAHEFARAHARIPGGAADAYRRLFRDGDATALPGLTLPEPARVQRSQSPEGEVVKFVLRVPPNLETESVLIPMVGRTRGRTYTLCVSSQVGCAMGCTFCETAQMGLLRSLTPAEIVAQWFAATHHLRLRPKNIVFMGMGEPLDNLAGVLAAIRALTDHLGAAHPMSRIVVSTVGRLDGLARLAAQVREPGWHRLGLAVSINAPNDQIRSRIMPINRAMPMAALREALLAWPIFGAAKICLEYVLIPGVNDATEHARELASWARPLPACINVIPYNPRRDSPWPAPDEASVDHFLGDLVAAGAYCKRRRTKGREMMGACGQLGNPQLRRPRLVRLGAPASSP
ncbi:MAG: 23S rRNA (adenine(2503)-C(2))-methyltransferase RlmN [Phycisphaerae bacterium]|nr:23S rRNA (adenine(2503)-C(2))-methyltransferase RlmN [Phycisphaerae bacterium]